MSYPLLSTALSCRIEMSLIDVTLESLLNGLSMKQLRLPST